MLGDSTVGLPFIQKSQHGCGRWAPQPNPFVLMSRCPLVQVTWEGRRNAQFHAIPDLNRIFPKLNIQNLTFLPKNTGNKLKTKHAQDIYEKVG